MLASSPKDRSRSPHRTNGVHVIPTNSSTKHAHDTSSLTDPTALTSSSSSTNNRTKKDNESQSRMKTLKSFILILINNASSFGSTYDEQVKGLESACMKEFQDLSLDRIRRMIRSVFKGRKSHQSSHTNSSSLHQDHPATTSTSTTPTERFNSNEGHSKRSRTNSALNNSSTKTASELIPSSSSAMTALDADFLRHAFSQQFRPSMDLSAYFSAAATAAAASNGASPASSLFRPNFSPSNFLQSLTTPPLPLPTIANSSSHTHTNGNNDSSVSNVNKLSKQVKLSNNESHSIKVLVNAYREAASYLNRSADELELLI